MEQSEVIAVPSIPTTSLKRVLSDEVRASLEAVRVAQENARLRARRQTVQARIWFLVLVGGVAAAAVVAPRLARHGRHKAVASAQPSPVARALAAPAKLSTDTGAKAALPAVPTAAAARVATEQAPAVATDNGEGCDSAAIRTAPWRLSPEACTRAFAADPGNASLALAVAHAEHARGHFDEAAQWARRALALDEKTAEAYVIIARAEAENGHHELARRAYRSYLRLAPRGWHHDEARAALRGTSS